VEQHRAKLGDRLKPPSGAGDSTAYDTARLRPLDPCGKVVLYLRRLGLSWLEH
jgi:hypothetical protein